MYNLTGLFIHFTLFTIKQEDEVLKDNVRKLPIPASSQKTILFIYAHHKRTSVNQAEVS